MLYRPRLLNVAPNRLRLSDHPLRRNPRIIPAMPGPSALPRLRLRTSPKVRLPKMRMRRRGVQRGRLMVVPLGVSVGVSPVSNMGSGMRGEGSP